MAVVYQDKTETKVSVDATSITCAPPAFDVGDLFIAVIVKDDDNAMSTPAGWTLVEDNQSDNRMRCNVFRRIAEAGDSSWTWTGDNEMWIGWILRYKGHDATTPIHASSNGVGETVSPIAPTCAYTGLAVGSIALQLFGADDDDTPYTTPVALTERFSADAVGCGGAGGDKSVSGTGSTGTATFGQANAEEWVGITLIIEASSGGGITIPIFMDYYRRRRI